MEEYAFLMSDLHTEQQQHREEALPEDQIILAGDIANGVNALPWLEKHPYNIFYVPGNHEYYGAVKTELDQTFRQLRKGHVRVLLTQALETKTAYIMGTTLWSSWDTPDPRVQEQAKKLSEDSKHIHLTECQNWSPEMAILQHAVEKKALQHMWQTYKGHKTKVVVTHHPPTVMSLVQAGMPTPWVLPNAFDSLDTIPSHTHRLASYTTNDEAWFSDAARHGVKLWCHGHLHRHLDYMHHGIRVVCNPKGYKKEKRSVEHRYQTTRLNLTHPVEQWLEQEQKRLEKAITTMSMDDYGWSHTAEKVRDWYNEVLRKNGKTMTAKADYEKSKLLETLGKSF